MRTVTGSSIQSGCSALRSGVATRPCMARTLRPNQRPLHRSKQVAPASAPSGAPSSAATLLDDKQHAAAAHTTTTTHTNGSPATQPQAQPAKQAFPWRSHWYPVAVLRDLDPLRPNALHLLGTPMAVWKDKSGQWQAVEDLCPHRLAPLSEGRIEADGTLQCAYHGWQFNGKGACTHIPQLRNDDKAQQVACSSKRSCVRAFPTQELHGLLWVLPDSTQEAWDKAASKPLPSMALPELLDKDSGWEVQGVEWFTRDLPLRADTLLENLIDPSHLPFAHHGVMGRRSGEKGTTTTTRELNENGFISDYTMSFGSGVVRLQAPVLTRYDAFKGAYLVIIWATPTKPGWSRAVHGYVRNTRVNALPWPVVQLLNLRSAVRWFDHVKVRHPIFDGDTYFLHVLERNLLGKGNDWRNGFFLPAPADGSVVALRKWFDTFGLPPTCEMSTPMPPQLTKREALDRYEQHTKHCPDCQKALRFTERASVVAAVAGALAVLWLLARAAVGLPLLCAASAPAAAVAAAAGLAFAALRGLHQQFFFEDYVHADKH